MLLFDNRIYVFIKMSKVFSEVEKQQVAVGKMPSQWKSVADVCAPHTSVKFDEPT
jgi:hypothetical protein